ncbi:MAG: peptidylprolyl isomerase [Cyclobacteriaceae bacterium]
MYQDISKEEAKMAVINDIRKRSGLLLTVVLVGVVLFILGDFIAGQFRGGQQKRIVGEAAGEEIPAELFGQEIEKMESQYTLFNNRRPQEYEKDQIKDQAWNAVLFQTIYKNEFEKLGLVVTRTADGEDNEENDMLTGGKTMEASLRSAPIFRNQQTGQFDVNKLNQFIGVIQNPQNQEQAMMRAQWMASSEQMYQQRLRQKYESLLSKTTYVTTAEAEAEYIASEKTGVFDYVFVPLSSIKDEEIEVTDSELENYLDANEKEFTVDESRSIDYVTFAIAPNEEDEARTIKKVNELSAQFSEGRNDSTFAKAKTDPGTKAVAKYSKDDLPDVLGGEKLLKGTVYGPYLSNKIYKLYKYIGTVNDTTFNNPSSSHILFTTQGLDPEQKKAKKAQAQDVLNRALKGENFTILAFQFSEDPGSKQKGGDLGEFGKGQMVKPFQDAVFGAKKTGVVSELVESQFGYHIINVTKKVKVDKIEKKQVLAEITKEITPGKNTRNTIFRKASAFVRDSKESGLDAAVEATEGISKTKDIQVTANSRYVGSLANASEVSRWAYQQEEVGAVSNLIKLDGQYVVASISKVKHKDDLSVENLRDDLKEKVIAEKKRQLLADKLAAQSGSVAEIKEAYNSTNGKETAQKEEGVSASLSSATFGISGYNPEVIGAAFGLGEGQTSSVIKGESGVFIVKAISFAEAPEIADYTAYKKRLAAPKAGSVSVSIDRALQELNEVQDMRYLQ